MTTKFINEKLNDPLDQGEWRFFPHMILRSAGFPLKWLTQFTFTDTMKLVEEKKRLDEKWNETISECNNELEKMLDLTTKQKKKLISQLRRYKIPTAKGSTELLANLGAGFQIKLEDMIEKMNYLEAQISKTFQTELDRQRHHLKQVYLENESLQEAVFLSSPDAYHNGLKHFLSKELEQSRPRGQRQKEQLAAIYLQRFTSKNETASYYGPTNYGTFTSQPGLLELHVNGPIKRQLFMSYWAVQSLANYMAEDDSILPYLKPKLSPFIKRENSNLRQSSNGKLIQLPEIYHKMIRYSDGNHNIHQIAAMLDLSTAECIARIQKLKEKRIILLEIDFPTSVFDPFEKLKEKIQQLPNDCSSKSKWLHVINEWSSHLITWKESESFQQRRHILTLLENSFEQNVGLSSRKDRGKHYTDRLIVFEEARGDVETCRIGLNMQKQWKDQLEPIFKLISCRAAVEHRALTEFAYKEYQSFNSDVNFLTFALHMQGCKTEALQYAKEKLKEFDNRLSEWTALHPFEKGSIVIAKEDVDAFCLNFPQPDVALFSPDIMIAADDVDAINEGKYKLILGEVHSGIQVWSVLNSVYPDQLRLNEEIYHHLGPTLQSFWLEHVGPRAPGKTFRPELSQGTTVENLGRSMKSREYVRSIAELGLIYENERFYVTEGEKPKLMDLETDVEPLNQIFSLPSVKSFSIQIGEHTPRIEINGVVFQRERWTFACKELLVRVNGYTDWLLLDWATDLRKNYNMPRYVYARGNNEPKPIFVDFHNFFTLEVLYQLLKRNEHVSITEMVPAQDSLWFTRGENKHTAEFRFSVIHENLT
ncbi:lantibiotic dehydratase [Halalkalibacterium halodurans]|uniref:lantibiotic dehydratase n=1 Tax=Halalkalibacterium halodurans TaxID=86665 RepID=UPI002AA9A304|nr:lantibiotic dehydratase [Halalkalibacterium halodurans]MDY7222593.1 lantibiotic dehydratase [Halalkalibacterium halodurans]MDY7241814.1 lantibiotic dehydratase [Halalkalibacterium halodurans]